MWAMLPRRSANTTCGPPGLSQCWLQGIEDVELHSKAISVCSLPARAVLQLRLHPNAALCQHSEHPPDLMGFPLFLGTRSAQCRVQGLASQASCPHCKPGE